MKKPLISMTILSVIVLACLFAATYEKGYMNLEAANEAPSMTHIFGTDQLGRDLFSLIWYGGRISLYIGILATIISTGIGVIYGCISGLCGPRIDDLLMRFTEILLSIPSVLLVIFLQAMLGESKPTSIAVVIGVTSWMSIGKIVRSEVRQIGESDYVLAAKTMGGSFFYILRRHLIPNFIPATMFMIINNMGQAIGTEAMLSFFGIGLPINIISWGSLMSLSERAMMTGSWWMIIIPGLFLVITMVSLTEIGEYIKKKNTKLYSNL